MKFLLSLFFIALLSNSNKQEPVFKYIPTSLSFHLANGWHKYNSEGVIFDVEIINGKLNKGKIEWIDGTKYSGGLNNNGVHGKGTYNWSNGDKYEGSFSNNNRHGKGTMYWNDGTKFVGKFKYNKRHGRGKLYDVNGNLIKEGKWEKGVLKS